MRQKAREGVSVLVVLHDLNLAASFADRVLVLNRGSIAALGSPQDVLTPQLVEEVFKVKTSVLKAGQGGKIHFSIRSINRADKEVGVC